MHAGRPRYLASYSDGQIDTTAAPVGRISIPRFSTRAERARSLWRSAGAHSYSAAAIKKTICGQCGWTCMGWYDRRERQARDLPNGQMRIYLRFEIRRIHCRRCDAVKRESLDFLADNPFYTKRFAYY